MSWKPESKTVSTQTGDQYQQLEERNAEEQLTTMRLAMTVSQMKEHNKVVASAIEAKWAMLAIKAGKGMWSMGMAVRRGENGLQEGLQDALAKRRKVVIQRLDSATLKEETEVDAARNRLANLVEHLALVRADLQKVKAEVGTETGIGKENSSSELQAAGRSSSKPGNDVFDTALTPATGSGGGDGNAKIDRAPASARFFSRADLDRNGGKTNRNSNSDWMPPSARWDANADGSVAKPVAGPLATFRSKRKAAMNFFDSHTGVVETPKKDPVPSLPPQPVKDDSRFDGDSLSSSNKWPLNSADLGNSDDMARSNSRCNSTTAEKKSASPAIIDSSADCVGGGAGDTVDSSQCNDGTKNSSKSDWIPSSARMDAGAGTPTALGPLATFRSKRKAAMNFFDSRTGVVDTPKKKPLPHPVIV